MGKFVSRKIVLAAAASEFLAFMLLTTLVGSLLPWIFLTIFVINSIAGTIIFDLQINKADVPFNNQIQNSRISLGWGFRKMLRNNVWWRH